MKAQDYSFRYCFGSTAAILMFDTSRKQTFERIESFIQQTDRCKIPFIVLVGNKVDITNSKIGVDK